MKYLNRLRLVVFLLITGGRMEAQQNSCAFKPPVVKIDFGAGNITDINAIDLPKYRRDFTTCPNDGYYSFTSKTSDCFNHDWLTIDGDHTGGSNGNMMLVNASTSGGIFFYTKINGLSSNTTYQLSVWMMNVCRINGGCQPLPPNITIKILTPRGDVIGLFKTGLLTQGYSPHWTKFSGMFQTPANVTFLNLTMADNTLGGCGNDFAMDDITLSECIISRPEVKNKLLPVSQTLAQRPLPVKQASPMKSRVVKQAPVKIEPAKRDNAIPITKPFTEKPTVIPDIQNRPVLKLPEPILTRANPVVKEIETGTGEIRIDLYDNGEIDGDTVSIYHNNQLIVSGAGLSDKPVTFRFKVDKMHPHHELTMVANNLGSIPPNTSMMIITASDKRYEVFISSSEQKNAKVVFELKE